MIDKLLMPLWPAASWVLVASCKSIAVIALVLACRWLLSPWLSAQARHSLWFAVIACLALPFGLTVDAHLFGAASLLNTASQETSISVSSAASSRLAMGSPPSHDANLVDRGEHTSSATADLNPAVSHSDLTRVSVRSWLIALWLCVAVFLLGYALWNQARYFRIRSAAQELDSSTRALFLHCKAQLNLNRHVYLLQATDIRSPAVFGWWAPTLLLPLGLASQLSEKQLRYVFLHELVHVQRHDILVNWLTAIVQIVHWFNPFVWCALRVMRADMEQACDANVMRYLNTRERIDYGKTLIRLTDFHPGRLFLAHGAGIVESHSQLKERIQMISQFNPKKIRYSLVAAVMLTAITSVAVTQPRVDSVAKTEKSHDGVNLATSASGQQPVVRLAALPSEQANRTENLPSKVTQAENPQRPVSTPAAHKTDPSDTKASAVTAAASNAMAKDSILMGDLVGQVSINMHKKFVIDPRVKGIVVTLVGQKLDQIDYSGLLTILRINGCTAFELNGYVNIVPVSDARSMPVPIAVEGKDYPDDQWVSMTLGLKNACATQLVPMFRPLLPQAGHMAAVANSNSLLLIDTFANVKRIASMVRDLDARSTSNDRCGDIQVR